MSNFFDNYSTDNTLEYMNESFRVLNETNIVKMDMKTMKRRMMTRATLAAAKQADDPLYKKYVKHTKLRKTYRRQIEQKYASKAKVIVRQWMAANKGSDN